MKTVFKGKIFTVKQGEKPGEVKERAERKASIAVFPFTESGKLILLREFRPYVSETVITTVAGGVDGENDLEKEAMRELAEEAGVTAKNLKLFYKSKPRDSIVWNYYFFVATGLEKTVSKSEEDEVIETFECTLNEAAELVFEKSFRNELMGFVLLKLKNDLEKGLFKLP